MLKKVTQPFTKYIYIYINILYGYSRVVRACVYIHRERERDNLGRQSRFRAGTAYKYLDESINNLTYMIIYWTRSPTAELTRSGKVPNRSFSLKLLTLQFFQCPPVLR